jgi:hypothetical protein
LVEAAAVFLVGFSSLLSAIWIVLWSARVAFLQPAQSATVSPVSLSRITESKSSFGTLAHHPQNPLVDVGAATLSAAIRIGDQESEAPFFDALDLSLWDQRCWFGKALAITLKKSTLVYVTLGIQQQAHFI